MEYTALLKFIGPAKKLLEIFEKSGFRRLSTYILLGFITVWLGIGSNVFIYMWTNGSIRPIDTSHIVVLLVIGLLICLFYFVRTVTHILLKVHIIKNTEVPLNDEMVQTKDSTSETPSPTQTIVG